MAYRALKENLTSDRPLPIRATSQKNNLQLHGPHYVLHHITLLPKICSTARVIQRIQSRLRIDGARLRFIGQVGITAGTEYTFWWEHLVWSRTVQVFSRGRVWGRRIGTKKTVSLHWAYGWTTWRRVCRAIYAERRTNNHTIRAIGYWTLWLQQIFVGNFRSVDDARWVPWGQLLGRHDQLVVGANVTVLHPLMVLQR